MAMAPQVFPAAEKFRAVRPYPITARSTLII
jgi:hypothetical protein